MTLRWPDSLPETRPRRRIGAKSILMAAMLGLVDALGWERPPSEIVRLSPDLTTGDLDLEFDGLDPLD